MNSKTSFLFALLLITSSLCMATRPGSSDPFSAQLKRSSGKPTNNNKGGGNDDGGLGGIFGPGSGFSVPGFGNGIIGGGYGGGYGGPNGGHSKNGVIRPSTVCKEKGPCYMKKLTCPSKCFTSYSRSGKGYGGGGGGGGCTMDCKKKCIAYC
ncbi:putative glycine-rich cell wall structural protein 1 [Pistacia vera]|uniref:putative glycine-rich cell wall structural protein 1 n=1 Tax=Pistacia vera TaxID=55513 RepID=UPI00126322F2|nr:putative glycine-rich cell wall structural protein 1 [Pistacia vera]